MARQDPTSMHDRFVHIPPSSAPTHRSDVVKRPSYAGGGFLKATSLAVCLAVALLSGTAQIALAQGRPGGGPPPVGVIKAEKLPYTQTNEFVGRIQATDRVNLVPRVTAFLEQQLFKEGAEVKKGDLLYTLEKPPFEADVQAKAAAVQQAQATLNNAQLTMGRAKALLNTPAGQRSIYDDSRAAVLADEAQVMANQAQLRLAQINLAYTDIRAPIAGKIGRTSLTIGNVVTPNTGTLATIVSQDPMWILFPVPVPEALELRNRYYTKGGLKAVKIKLRLPDGRIYDQTGDLNFTDNTISSTTDTILLRATVANPMISKDGDHAVRELIDGEFVQVIMEGVQPVEALTIPRAAVLSDQEGNYVYTVNAQNEAIRTNVELGASDQKNAVVLKGLTPGQTVIVEGVQRVMKPGQKVAPGPASPNPATTPPPPAHG
ncbi:Acriflavin resistance periplasmic protein [Granulibacter bethesdensis]|uniref:Acriflavin resistance periplasmic protein n=2 Tax=Granulibacter bethesdensis TaxID=364410 RepID=A0AAN0RCV9_9PROT|nr:Acriflavin resistance periplasmic protein [Granulibacter bethesdensis]